MALKTASLSVEDVLDANSGGENNTVQSDQSDPFHRKTVDF